MSLDNKTSDCDGTKAQFLESNGITKPFCREYKNCNYAGGSIEYIDNMVVKECFYGRVRADKTII